MLAKFIQQQRKKHNLTQEYLASELGISRPTYVQIERGERELTVSEAKKLAAIFAISLEDFLAEKDTKHRVHLAKKPKKKSSGNLQIRVTSKNLEKFKQALLHILGKIGSKPNIGETVLYKLLYFIDFDYYEKFEENLIGATYIKNRYGPTPLEFKDIVKQMEKEGEIEPVKSRYFKFDQKKYLPLKRPNLNLLSAQEIEHIDWELDRLSGMSANQISDFSHIDTPWRVAQDMEKLDYELVFYRPKETSVREYEPL